MPVEDSIVVPDTTSIAISVEPALNAIQSLLLLAQEKYPSAASDWVIRMAATLTSEQLERNRLVLVGFHYATAPERSWPSFPAYVDHLAALDPEALRDKMLTVYARLRPLSERSDDVEWIHDTPRPLDLQSILRDVGSYLDFLRERFTMSEAAEELEALAYTYVVDPPAMQDLIVSHLREMWDGCLAPEWERMEPMLQDTVRAFRQTDFSGMSRLEAARLITGQAQKLEKEKWQVELEGAKQLIFVPSAHIGQYLGKGRSWTEDIFWVVFGAWTPEEGQLHVSSLDRADIVTRLSALADDTRLRILRLVVEEGELASREIMERLEISQSTASRHLQQLSATGYLSERRCDGAKCYALDADHTREVLRALSSFLLGDSY
jgi:ArsR family transcriptional regulator